MMSSSADAPEQGPIVGIIYDNYGPRLLLAVGTVLHVFGIMMTSLGKTYYQILLAQGVCSAIGASMIFGPGILPWMLDKEVAEY